MTDRSPEQHRGFPEWGTAAELAATMQPTRLDQTTSVYRAMSKPTDRNVVEGGQLLGAAATACADLAGDHQRLVHASMVFARAANHDDPIDITVEPARIGRSFSTFQTQSIQNSQACAAATLMFAAETPPALAHTPEAPAVAAPNDCPRFDFGVVGRDLRVVGGAYDPWDTELVDVGPPEIHVWSRFEDDPGSPELHTALLLQSLTHWTIAAALRPHAGFGESQAHASLSTGVQAVTVAVHEQPDVTDWLLTSTHAPWAGLGLAHGTGTVFTQTGTLVASFSVQAMIRPFDAPPDAFGKDATNAM